MDFVAGHKIVAIGAGSGLGRGVVRQLVAEGAEVTVLEVSEEKIASLTEEFGGSIVLVRGDATIVGDLERCRAEHMARFDGLDALICFQGIFDGNVHLANIPLENVGPLFDELFNINVKSSFLATKVFQADLLASNGAVVLTSSNAAYAADGGGAFYTATKGAIKSLVQQFAFELAPIRVNAVAPGAIGKSELRGPAALGMAHTKQSDIPVDAFTAGFRQLSLMTDLPAAEDYAPLYAFLASHTNKIMTGQTLLAEQGLLNRSILTPRT